MISARQSITAAVDAFVSAFHDGDRPPGSPARHACKRKTSIDAHLGAEPERSAPILLPGVGMDAVPDCSRDVGPATPLSVAAAEPPVVGELLFFAALTAPPVAAGGGVASAGPKQQRAEINASVLETVRMSSLCRSLVPRCVGCRCLSFMIGTRWRKVFLAHWCQCNAQCSDHGASDLQVLLIEGLIAFMLVLTVVAMASDVGVPANVAAAAIGFSHLAGVLSSGPVRGGAGNPARACTGLIYRQHSRAFIATKRILRRHPVGDVELVYRMPR